VEHNGDLYSCDHFVEPKHLLGNILRTPLAELLNSDRQLSFGENKRDTLPGNARSSVESNGSLVTHSTTPFSAWQLRA
jgi:uncharacterized protein